MNKRRKNFQFGNNRAYSQEMCLLSQGAETQAGTSWSSAPGLPRGSPGGELGPRLQASWGRPGLPAGAGRRPELTARLLPRGAGIRGEEWGPCSETSLWIITCVITSTQGLLHFTG